MWRPVPVLVKPIRLSNASYRSSGTASISTKSWRSPSHAPPLPSCDLESAENWSRSALKTPSDERIKSALDGIDTAAFQTIDSLVYSILREHPLEAGLPPVIEVQDDFAQNQMFRERWRQWTIDRLEQDDNFSESLATAIRLELKNPFGVINDLARAMNNKHGS